MAGHRIKFTCPHCGKEVVYLYAPLKLSPEEQLNAMPIEELGLSVRAYKGLKHLGVETVGELIRVRPPELVRLKNFGKKSLDEIREVLQKMNLSLNEPK